MSNNLGWPSVAPNQNQKEQTINDQAGVLDGALSNVLAIPALDLIELTPEQLNRNMTFRIDPTEETLAGNFDMVLPATARGLFTVINANGETYSVTIEITDQTETPPTLADGAVGLFHSDGVNVRKLI